MLRMSRCLLGVPGSLLGSCQAVSIASGSTVLSWSSTESVESSISSTPVRNLPIWKHLRCYCSSDIHWFGLINWIQEPYILRSESVRMTPELRLELMSVTAGRQDVPYHLPGSCLRYPRSTREYSAIDLGMPRQSDMIRLACYI